MVKVGLIKGLVVLVVAMAIVTCALFGGVTPEDLLSWLIPVLGTYFGASYGASYAFKLQQGKDEASAERAKVDALNRALMVMCFQYNEVASIWAKMRIFDVGELPRMLNFPAYRSPEFDYRQHVVDLAFLMQSGNANLLLEISVEQGRFDACMVSMKIRSEYFVENVEPLIEQHGIRTKPLSEQLLFDAFGERVFLSLRNMTSSLFDHFRQSEASLIETIEKLHRAAKQCYPDEKFFKVERVDTNPARSH